MNQEKNKCWFVNINFLPTLNLESKCCYFPFYFLLLLTVVRVIPNFIQDYLLRNEINFMFSVIVRVGYKLLNMLVANVSIE